MSNEQTTDTPEPTHEFLVQINYKSGHSQTMWFTKFHVTTNGGKIASVTWAVQDNGTHQPICIGIDEIESVFQLDVAEITK